MRIVTFVAVFSHRFMDVLHVEFILAVLMALKTQLSFFRRSNQQFIVLAGMGPMTGDTIPGSHRTMPVGLGKDRCLMTVEAQATDTGAIAAQLKTHRGFVGIMTVDTPFLDRLMDNAGIKLLLLCLMTDQAKLLTGAFHGHGIKRAVRAVTGDTDPGAHRPMHMGGLTHIGVAFPRGTIGPGRGNLFKIVLAASQLVTLLAVQGGGIAMEIKALIALGRTFIFLSRSIENLHLLLELIGAQTDDIFPFPESNHHPEGTPLHRHNSTGSLIAHAVDGNPLDLDTIDEAGQKKLLAGHPGAIERSNHGYFRSQGYGGRQKNTKANDNI